jgi:hypothetical protein
MKLLPLLLCSAALVMGGYSSSAAQTNAAPARPRAVFEEFAGGRDPFFPASSRRGRPISVPTTNAPALIAHVQLSLKGISVTKPPLALINNTTVAEGEVADIRSGARLVKIRCREIRDTSVLVEIVGSEQVQELKLREGI